MGRIIQPKGTKGSLKWIQYIVNDSTHIPTTREEWKGALQLMYSLLDSNRNRLSKYIIDVFIDVNVLPFIQNANIGILDK